MINTDICDERIDGDSDRWQREKQQSVVEDQVPASLTYWRTLCQWQSDKQQVQQLRPRCHRYRLWHVITAVDGVKYNVVVVVVVAAAAAAAAVVVIEVSLVIY